MSKKQWLKDKVMGTANAVNKVTGAEKLVDYASGKIAKRMVAPEARQFVKDDVSGKDALKSAGKVGLSIASVASVAGAARGISSLAAKGAAKKGLAKAAIRNAARTQGITPAKPSGMLKAMGFKDQRAELLKAAQSAGKNLKSNFPKTTKKLKVKSVTDKGFARLQNNMSPKANSPVAKITSKVAPKSKPKAEKGILEKAGSKVSSIKKKLFIKKADAVKDAAKKPGRKLKFNVSYK